MRLVSGIACLGLALLGCGGSNVGGTQDSGIISGDDGPAADLSVTTDGTTATTTDGTSATVDGSQADQTLVGDLVGADLCAPLTTTIAHPDADGCRTPGMQPVLFRALVRASCVDVTNQANFTWSTVPTSPLDGLTGNDRMATLPIGTYTIGLKATYMNQTATTSMTFSIKNTCP